jgi:hypothetical protein
MDALLCGATLWMGGLQSYNNLFFISFGCNFVLLIVKNSMEFLSVPKKSRGTQRST